MAKNPFGPNAVMSAREDPTGTFNIDIGHNKHNRYSLKDGKLHDDLEEASLTIEETVELANRFNNFMFDVMMQYAWVCARLSMYKVPQDPRESLVPEQFNRHRARYIEVIHGNTK